MTDLFEIKTKKQELLDFIRLKRRVSTADVMAWGLREHYISADRKARELATEGKIRRIPDSGKTAQELMSKQDYWEAI
jgi:hypothetical protein